MDEFFDIPTLIVIGLAIVVLFRLRQVLGTRTGRERTPLERQREAAPAKAAADENVVPMRPRPAPESNEDVERQQRRLETEITQFAHGDDKVAAGLKAIADADPSFSPKLFLEGAKSAYEMIVTAFAAGDRQTLKNLLEKEVYDGFERVIKDREAAGHKIDFTFVGLPKVEISDAELDKRNANVTIRFHAEVVSATRDKDGTLIEGNADQVTSIADEWTFARSPKSRDPNWKLVATSQLGSPAARGGDAMAKRRSDGKGQLPDWHLWHEVKQTISPLRPHRRLIDLESEPLPIPPVQKPKTHRLMPAMPSYQSDGRPGKKPPRPGIEPNLRQRLQRGREEIDGTIDLHGMRQVEAHAALTRFVQARAARGDRTLLVITGKGLKKLGDDAAVIIERGVLRAMLPVWLTAPNLAPLVAGWDTAAQGHGGDGAFYVRLRRERDYR